MPDVVYVGTPHDIVAKMLDLAKPTKEDVVYDLGCGDGRIVVAAAKKFGCRGIGFDINPVRIREALANVERNGVEELVTIERKDIFTLDLSPATVVTLYLLPVDEQEADSPAGEAEARLADRGPRLRIEGYTPDKTITVTSKEDAVEHYLYVWTTPLKKSDEKSAPAKEPAAKPAKAPAKDPLSELFPDEKSEKAGEKPEKEKAEKAKREPARVAWLSRAVQSASDALRHPHYSLMGCPVA